MNKEAATPTAEEESQTVSKSGERLGEKLLALGLVTPDQIEVALREKENSPKMLGAILVDLDFITEAVLNNILADSTGVERFDLNTTMVDPEAVSMVPKDVAIKHRILPISITDTTAMIAMADPHDVVALDVLRRYIPPGVVLQPWICPPADLSTAVDRAYGYEISIDGIVREMDTGEVDVAALVAGEQEGYTHPVVRLVDALLLDAVKVGASDLHFEPAEAFVRLRYRIDGVMRQIHTFHKDYWPAISQRLKIMSSMNIADKFNPQDGRITFTLANHEIDFRVSALPTIHGENLVLRVLDKSRALLTLDDLGFSENNLIVLRKILKRPEGIIIVTGPTGSGKTTTLYAILNFINSVEVNIMTLEDPVEYQLPLVRQAQVREGTGVNFSDGVRAILRQDPDIVLIGEVRDGETAQMALRAAMTGHQVFTTLHTNDALAAIARLLDLDVEPGLLAGNIIASMAQRLVRRLCPKCKEPCMPDEDECHLLGVSNTKPPTIYRSKGCGECGGAGYAGRIAVLEIVPMTEEMDELIAAGGNRSDLKARALKEGFTSMPDDGIEKVLAGVTDIASLIRAVDVTKRLK